jgi:hypothetical protein
MSAKAANGIIGDKKNLYRMVEEEGAFLPKFKSRAITTRYLTGVLSGEFFKFEKSKTLMPLPEKKIFSKIDLLALICEKMGNIDLGFSPDHMPDRHFLLSLVYSLSPNHEIFTGVTDDEKTVKIPLKFLQNLLFVNPDANTSRSKTFKLSGQERKEKEDKKLKRRILKKKRRQGYLSSILSKLGSEVHHLSDVRRHRLGEVEEMEVSEE